MLIRLLGEVSAGEDAGSLRPPRGRVATSVLAVLALARGRLVTTESLIDDLWDNPPDTARNAIQVAVSGLRKQFGPALVDGSRVGYRLRTDLVRIDWIEVEQYLATARDRINKDDLSGAEADASAARNLFAGSELAGADSASVRASRGLAVQLRRASSVMWAQALVGLGRRDEALAVLAEESNLSPLDEPVHILLMSALREHGRSAEALEVFESLRRRLDDELGVLPSPDSVDEFHRLLDSGVEVNFEIPEPVTHRPTIIALPTPGSPLLGREGEIAEIVGLMRSGHSLVTLLGPGGIGKTRLGIEAVRTFAELEQRSAIFLDLTLSRSDAETRRLLADVLGSETDAIVSALTASRTVVLLDNAEHLLDVTAALVAELIEIPDVRVLVTSRSAIEIKHERRFEVDGLESGSALSPAVQLLVERAAFSRRDADASAPALQTLAERCDGVPLVMELLGSALRWRSPLELLESLDGDLASITERSRNRPARHASLRAAIDWSVDHVSPDARRALGVLATVRGTLSGATADALIARIGLAKPLDALAELVDASLVKRVREPGAILFRMLEPIRLVAQHLDEMETASHLVAHAEVYLGRLVLVHDRMIYSTSDFDDLIVVESHNLALAAETRWREDPDRAVGEVARLLYGWYRRDRGPDVERWGAVILESHSGSPLDRARVAVAVMMTLVGYNGLDGPTRAEEFDELNERVLRVGADLDDEWHRRWLVVNHLRWVEEGDYDRAASWVAQMRLTNPIAAFWVHISNATVHRSRGQWREAIAEGELAILELDSTTHASRLTQTHSDLGFVKTIVGDFDSAEKEIRQALEYAESHGLGFERMSAQVNLAFLTGLTGRPRECLGLVLAGLDWTGGLVFDAELAAYAAIALHSAGDDSSASALATFAASSHLAATSRKPRRTDQLHLNPHWKKLLSEVPQLVTDSAGGWDTSVARTIVAEAIARLPIET